MKDELIEAWYTYGWVLVLYVTLHGVAGAAVALALYEAVRGCGL